MTYREDMEFKIIALPCHIINTLKYILGICELLTAVLYSWPKLCYTFEIVIVKSPASYTNRSSHIFLEMI